MSAKDIFISYRRDDAGGHARLLFDRLGRHFPGRIFFDHASIDSGVVFRDRVQQAIADAKVVLALIASGWLTVTDATGRRRLEDPGDFVRFELALALKQPKRVIPVLIDGTAMPGADALPDDLKALAARDAHRLGGKTYEYDRQLVELVRLIGAVLPGPMGLTEIVPEQWPRSYDSAPFALNDFYQSRTEDRKNLTQWLCRQGLYGDVPILTVVGIPGSGKSSISWVWMKRDVLDEEVPGFSDESLEEARACAVDERSRLGLRLFRFSFYPDEGGGDFERFLEEAIVHFSAGRRMPVDFRVGDRIDHSAIARALLQLIRTQRSLIVWDGSERLLVEYGTPDTILKEERTTAEVQADASSLRCVQHSVSWFLWALAGQTSCKLLLVSRLPFGDLAGKAGCKVKELGGLDPESAARYLKARGIVGPKTRLKEAAAWFEGHPLSLSSLVASLQGDFENTADIGAAAPIDLSEGPEARRKHVLRLAYERRAPHRQELLSRLAAIHGIISKELVSLVARDVPGLVMANLGRDVNELERHHLLRRSVAGGDRFSFHPVVRRYAYSRLRNPKGVHAYLAEFFRAAAAMVDVRGADSLDEVRPLVERYHHLARAGMGAEAFRIWKGLGNPKLSDAIWYRFAGYRLCCELLEALFPNGISGVPAVRAEHQALVVADLALVYWKLGLSRRARDLTQRAVELQKGAIRTYGDHFEEGGRDALAMGYESVARMDMELGSLKNADGTLKMAKRRHKQRGNRVGEIGGLVVVIRLKVILGGIKEAKRLVLAAPMDEDWKVMTRLELAIWADDSEGAREVIKEAPGAIERFVRGRFATAEEVACERGYLLGGGYRLTDELVLAEGELSDALGRARRIGWLEKEAECLLQIGKLVFQIAGPGTVAEREDEERLVRAEGHAEEAVGLAHWCGYRLQEAEGCLLLAEIGRTRGRADDAYEKAYRARQLAECDREAGFFYRRVYEAADKLVGELGACGVRDRGPVRGNDGMG